MSLKQSSEQTEEDKARRRASVWPAILVANLVAMPGEIGLSALCQLVSPILTGKILWLELGCLTGLFFSINTMVALLWSAGIITFGDEDNG